MAYTSSDASSYKYIGYGSYGSALTESYPSNTQLLRGYILVGNQGNPTYIGDYYGDGTY